jgi:chromate reductase, NAD(P)H dehydrogenase (quinone)
MNEMIKILSFTGSLRKGSYNKALLYAASELVPVQTDLEIFDLNGIPLFNQDLEGSVPDAVTEFKKKIRAADALLIATPEHNFSIPGVLKNAIDWASRPHGDNSFEGKPVAIISASTGMLGGARAQYQLRQSFVFLNMYPINKPEIFVSFAGQKFDSEGRLTDSKTSELIAELLVSLVAWVKRLNE